MDERYERRSHCISMTYTSKCSELAKKTGRTKQDLLREAVNTLLVEYRMFDLPFKRKS